jgi:hypothetical protein
MLKSPSTTRFGMAPQFLAPASRAPRPASAACSRTSRCPRLAVDHVEVDHPQAADAGGDDALLLVLEAGNADLHVAGGVARKDRHAVVGLLPGEHAAVAQRGELASSGNGVLQLGFLQADDVGRADFSHCTGAAGAR